MLSPACCIAESPKSEIHLAWDVTWRTRRRTEPYSRVCVTKAFPSFGSKNA